MPTNTKPTIPTLLAEWEGMSQRERDAEIAQLDGWVWMWRKSRGAEVNFWDRCRGLMPPERDGWVRTNYNAREWFEWDGVEPIEPFADWDRMGLNRKTNDVYVPFYTSEDSPASLLRGVKAKVIEKVGFQAYFEALWEVVGNPPWRMMCGAGNLEQFQRVDAATEDQKACACWIAERMAQGGEG